MCSPGAANNRRHLQERDSRWDRLVSAEGTSHVRIGIDLRHTRAGGHRRSVHIGSGCHGENRTFSTVAWKNANSRSVPTPQLAVMSEGIV